MKKRLALLGIMIVGVLLTSIPASPATAAPTATITLLNPPPSGLLELAVGESYTFDILITSDEPFVLAMAMRDAYYPGRAVFWHDSDRVTQDTSALLHLTITGKNPTTDLAAVCDWPEPGACWPEGVAPLSIVAGVRYKGGQAAAETFPFAVKVH
ncbi:MAG: hypothetical protein KKA73_20160 [Chloroflexi bacterium]|nr:hypothetical protein [Chloroflexota bacterium]MBU1750004.1 hypothetical protein [Chloroflexota bacterium]